MLDDKIKSQEAKQELAAINFLVENGDECSNGWKLIVADKLIDKTYTGKTASIHKKI